MPMAGYGIACAIVATGLKREKRAAQKILDGLPYEQTFVAVGFILRDQE